MAQWLRCLPPKTKVAGLSNCWIPISRLAWALRRAVYGASATETPLGTIFDENGISFQFHVYYLVKI